MKVPPWMECTEIEISFTSNTFSCVLECIINRHYSTCWFHSIIIWNVWQHSRRLNEWMNQAMLMDGEVLGNNWSKMTSDIQGNEQNCNIQTSPAQLVLKDNSITWQWHLTPLQQKRNLTPALWPVPSLELSLSLGVCFQNGNNTQVNFH